MILANALVTKNTLFKSISIVQSHSSSLMFKTPLFLEAPAQLTKTSTLPNSSSVFLAHALTFWVEVTSHLSVNTLTPYCFLSSLASATSLSSLLAKRTRFAC